MGTLPVSPPQLAGAVVSLAPALYAYCNNLPPRERAAWAEHQTSQVAANTLPGGFRGKSFGAVILIGQPPRARRQVVGGLQVTTEGTVVARSASVGVDDPRVGAGREPSLRRGCGTGLANG